MTHILACALFCNSDGSLNSGGTFLADAILGILGFGVVVWVIRMVVQGVKDAARPRGGRR